MHHSLISGDDSEWLRNKVPAQSDGQDSGQLSSLQCMSEEHPQVETGQIAAPSDDFYRAVQRYCEESDDSLMDLELDDSESIGFTPKLTQNTIGRAMQREPSTIPGHVIKQVKDYIANEKLQHRA